MKFAAPRPITNVYFKPPSGGSLVQSTAHGSFGIEVFALEELITNLTSLYHGQGVADNSWETIPTPFVRECIISPTRI